MADQTDLQKEVIINDLLLPVEILQKARTDPATTILKKDIQAAPLQSAALSHQEVKRKALARANHTLAGQQAAGMTSAQKEVLAIAHLAKRKALHPAANHIQAAHQQVVMTIVQKEVLAINHQAKRKTFYHATNHTLAGRQVMMTALKEPRIEAMAILHQETENQQELILAINPKEHLLINRQATANSRDQNQPATLKNAMVINHFAKQAINLFMIK